MRPLELKLRNFKSFFGEGFEFDFRGRHLVGIVGPIGSGKSSILDAISFALYGKTPSVAANTKSLIHQRADDAAVSLRFEVEGEVWEAVRMLRRKGASQHALYRYAHDSAVDPIEKVLLEGEVNARVAELLGLEFAAFGRSVLLAQGRFAEFLQARPSERDKVLKGVFGHDRIDAMRQAARSRAGRAAVDVEKLTLRVEQLERLQLELAELREQVADADTRVGLFKNAEPGVSDLTVRLGAAEKLAADVSKRLESLADLGARFPDSNAAERIISNAVKAGGGRERSAALLDEARKILVAADEKAARHSDEDGAAKLEQASALAAKLEPLEAGVTEAEVRRDRVVSRLETHKAKLLSAEAEFKSAAAAEDAASAAAEVAVELVGKTEAAFHDAQHADMAASLRTGLAVGESCPVCAQSIVDLPVVGRAPRLQAAVEEHAAATSASDVAVKARARSSEQLAVAVTERDTAIATTAGFGDETAAAQVEAEAARGDVTAVESELLELLGVGEASALLRSLRREAKEIAAGSAAAREKVDRTRADHDQAIRDEQSADKALSVLRIDIVDLTARIGVSLDTSDATPEGVADRLAALRAAWETEQSVAERERLEAERDRDSAVTSRNEVLAGLGVAGDFAAALAGVNARSDLLRADIGRRETTLAESAKVVEERDDLAGVKATFDRVATDLTDARFVRYLLDEERARLSELGSEHFLRLSSGRYLFTSDGSFNVVDQTAADAIRKAESLSGGETFLASLSLALALAEMVNRTGGRLDSFFLDEGFGSLDPEHLDLAMDGIEALVAGDAERLVVVVSHVPELRERFEDLIVLNRNPVTGDTRVTRA